MAPCMQLSAPARTLALNWPVMTLISATLSRVSKTSNPRSDGPRWSNWAFATSFPNDRSEGSSRASARTRLAVAVGVAAVLELAAAVGLTARLALIVSAVVVAAIDDVLDRHLRR